MRTIQIILLIGSYACLLPFAAELMADSFATCMRANYGSMGLTSMAVGLCLLLGYSQSVAGRPPWNGPKFFWFSSIGFNLLVSLAAFRTHRDWPSLLKLMLSRFSYFSDAFYPVLKLEQTLGGIAGLALVFAMVWMPLAALLSVIALAITWIHQKETQAQPSGADSSEPHLKP